MDRTMIDILLNLTEQDLTNTSRPDALRLYPSPGGCDSQGIEILWAPFDYINRDAKLVIVGVTPGPNQALRSYQAVRLAVARGAEPQTEIAKIKVDSSFRGDVIESNLKSLLEHSGLAERAGIQDIDDLWAGEAHKVHFTSTIRYPTFIGDKLFNNQIDSLRHPVLRRYVETYLSEELAAVPLDAVIVALGQKGSRIVRHAARVSGIASGRVEALPHPSSSANGAVRDYLSKYRTQSIRPCRCMLCDRTRIPEGWDLSSRYRMHDLTHSRVAPVDLG
jgi:hypothetical protein